MFLFVKIITDIKKMYFKVFIIHIIFNKSFNINFIP
jgi:hypothetical protein